MGPNHLKSAQLMNRMLAALENQIPLSVVSVGQTEAFVMAQYTIYSEDEFIAHREAYNANREEKAVLFTAAFVFPI